MSEEKTRARLGELAGEIESEMRRLGVWREQPPSEEDVLAGGAFGMGTVSFDAWLQVVFVHRLRQVAEGTLSVPTSSSVGAKAVREWDGDPFDRDVLLDLINQVDSLVR
jgi:uncharacterized protein YqcC (DUF446 family)